MNNFDKSPQVTVIVPTKNSGRTIKACLESIKTQSLSCTLVVVDNYSSDDTFQIAQSIADIAVQCGPERSAQRNHGASLTSDPIVGFIDSDMILTSDVVRESVDAIQLGAATVIVPEETIGEGYWAKVSTYERSFYNGDDAIEAPRFFTREVLDFVGGWDETMTGAEDWDLAIRTESYGSRLRISSKIIHDEGRVKYFDICLKKKYYASGVLIFLQKHRHTALKSTLVRSWMKPNVFFNKFGIGLLLLKAGQGFSMLFGIFKAKLGSTDEKFD